MEKSSREIQKIMHPLKFRMLSVKNITQVSPRMKRVTFTGSDLEGFVSASPDDHVKIFFPKPGEDVPVVPKLGPQGPEYSEGERPIMRDYTPLRYDPVLNELDIEFVLRDQGPGTTWAKDAKVGQVLGVGGPRGSQVVPYTFDWYLLIGDEVAIPSIIRRLSEMPSNARALVFIEVESVKEERAIPSNAQVEVHWIHRNGLEAGTSKLLKEAILRVSFPHGDYFSWVSTEHQSAKEIKEFLETVRGAHPEWMKAKGYWKKGTSED